MAIRSYKDAGVDIQKGDSFAEFIGKIKSPAISSSIGGFSGGIELDTAKYRKPVILSTTDGVGTKLLIAKELGIYETIGIDLVAMCVNDLIVNNAEPMVFLDYIACGGIDEKKLQSVVKGIVAGCEQAHCILAGGETAEMPDMYSADDIDLAGFCVGVAEKERMIPQKERMRPGDVILGLPSEGIHSNGLSLARKVIPPREEEIYRKLLDPTKIYVEEMKTLLSSGKILGAAHITGGGLAGNLNRVIPKNLQPRLDWDWKQPELFGVIKKRGGIAEEEMRRVFNMGVGLALIVSRNDYEEVMELAGKNSIEIFQAGELTDG